MNPLPFRPRLWPAWVLILAATAIAASTPFLATRTILHFAGLIGGPILATIGILLWWVAASRVRGADRWWPAALFVIGGVIVWRSLYAEYPLRIAFILAPAVALAWVLWLTLGRRLPAATQRAGLAATIALCWAATFALRVDGMDAEMVPVLRWAWTPSDRELFERDLASRRQAAGEPGQLPPLTVSDGDWPEFRGRNRDGRAAGRIRTDWTARAPQPLWKIRVGAGWGSFSIVGDRAFTQEQRGGDEAVVCYHALTGQELWEHRVPARFKEDISGEGPRGTPTVHDGRVYAFGGTGQLAALDGTTGERLWLRDVCADVGATVPAWGFASSPLVVDDLVFVFTAAKGKAVAAYRRANGELAWAAGAGDHGYSSPHRAVLHGEQQLLMVSDYGIQSFRPADGTILWEREWKLPGQNRVAQPTLLADDEILLGTAVGGSQGAERFRVKHADGRWTTEQVWRGRSPKPYFNDGVVLDDYYYGWDDRNFICLNLRNGKVEWNEGSLFGFGQVLLLADQKLLLVQMETGPVALIEPDPREFVELARFGALGGRTWNHPVVVRGRLYVRNSGEAACYDILEAATIP